MGKQARRANQQEARTAPNKRQLQRPPSRVSPRWLVAGAVVVVAALVVTVIVLTGGSRSALPAGTMIFSEKNHKHVTGLVHYNRNPPAGGAHSAVWTNCGVYTQVLSNEHAVHDLEHGAVWITYRPTLPARQILELQQFVETHYDGPQRYLLLSPYPGLPAPVVATAWGAQIRLTGPTDPRLAVFTKHFEGGAQGGEPGAPCTGGVGTPQA